MLVVRKLYAVYAALGLALGLAVVLVSLDAKFAPPAQVQYLDKFIHFWGYALVTFSVMIFPYKKAKYRIFAWVFIIWGSGMVELMQHFVPNRTASWLDFFANTLGILFGGIVGSFLSMVYQNRFKARSIFWRSIEYLRGL